MRMSWKNKGHMGLIDDRKKRNLQGQNKRCVAWNRDLNQHK